MSEALISFYRQAVARGISQYQLDVASSWAFEALAFDSLGGWF